MFSFSSIIFSIVLICSIRSLAGQQEFDCTDKQDGIYENPQECSTFYKCSGNNAYLYSCSVPLLFNPTLKICDWPQDFQCNKGSTGSDAGAGDSNDAEEKVTTKTPEFDCSNLPSGLYPNPSDCSTFYKCSNTYAYLYDCPSNLLFNPELLVCDWPYNVPSCQGPANPETEEPSTEGSGEPVTDMPEEPSTVASDEPHTEIPEEPQTEDPEDATTKDAEESETQSPAEPTTGNEEALPTTTARDATTESEAVTEGSGEEDQSTTDSAQEFSCQERPSGLYPNPTDCSTFYKCSNGYTYLYDCPSNLLFNPDLLVCDWPYNVISCQEQGESTTGAEGLTEEPETEAPGTDFPEEPDTVAPGTDFPETESPEEPTTKDAEESETETPEEPTTENVEPQTTENEEANTTTAEELSTLVPVETSTTSQADPETQEPTTESEAITEGSGEEDQSTTESAQEFSCQERPSGLYPNPTDCSTFYKCSNGYTYLYDCPSNLLFNPELLVCDWPYNVPSCQEQGESTTDAEDLTEEPETEAPGTDFPVEPDTEAPGTGSPEEPDTEAPATDFPVEPETEEPTTEAEESETQAPEEPTTENDEPQTTENAEESSTTTAEEISTLVPEETSTTSQADPETEEPTTESEAITEGSGEEDQSTTESAQEFSCQERPSGLYPNPTDCSTFYKCSNGYTYLYNCPSNLLFNPDLLVCDWPYNVPSCQEQGESTTDVDGLTEETETEAPGTDLPEEPNTEAPEEPETEVPSEQPETEEPTTVENIPTTTDLPEPFSCENRPSGLYSNPTDCTTFYKCSNGYSYLYNCPSILLFNPDLLVCDWPYNVPSCNGNDNEPEEKSSTTENPSSQAEDIQTSSTAQAEFSCSERPSGLYSNPEDCQTFYKCSNGDKYLYNCPSILLFNPDLLVCDWPQNVPSCNSN